LFCTTNPIPVKAALELSGWPVGAPRLPLLSAASGSPWLPVISSRVSRSGRSRICLMGTHRSSGARM
ncbi:MAG: hypothetical protein ACKOGI_11375, partial [Vulcanococcus sp.]